MSAITPTNEKETFEHGKDLEKASSHGGYVTDAAVPTDGGEGHMHRSLKGRHISMIAIAGTIGTGLFLGSGNAIANGGPVGALIGYGIVGCLVGAMMYSLGEMMVWDPSASGFIEFSARYVDPAMGFAMGWGYWFQTVITSPVEVVAAAIVIQYWDSNNDHLPAYIIVFIVPMTIINIVGVKYFGEFEFWFAFIKIAAIVGLVLMCLVVMLGGAPDKDRRGFRYWRDEPFNSDYLNFTGSKSRFLGFWAVLTQAAFSYGGMETLASIALEAENPRVTMKTAVRAVFYRIVLLYCLSLFLVGLCVRRSDPSLLDANSKDNTAARSPFVVVIRGAGIKVLDHIVNAVVLTSAFSSGNEFMYASSRALFMLAQEGQAPAIFTKITKQGVPIYAVFVSFLFSFLSFLTVSSGGSKAFTWLGNITALGSMITWWGIGVTFLRFYYGMKRQGMSRDILPFHTKFQPYFAWAVVVSFTIIIFFNGWTTFHGGFQVENFFSSYVNIGFVGILFVGWKFYHKTSIVSLDTMDLSSHYQEGSEVFGRIHK